MSELHRILRTLPPHWVTDRARCRLIGQCFYDTYSGAIDGLRHWRTFLQERGLACDAPAVTTDAAKFWLTARAGEGLAVLRQWRRLEDAAAADGKAYNTVPAPLE